MLRGCGVVCCFSSFRSYKMHTQHGVLVCIRHFLFQAQVKTKKKTFFAFDVLRTVVAYLRQRHLLGSINLERVQIDYIIIKST